MLIFTILEAIGTIGAFTTEESRKGAIGGVIHLAWGILTLCFVRLTVKEIDENPYAQNQMQQPVAFVQSNISMHPSNHPSTQQMGYPPIYNQMPPPNYNQVPPV